MALWVLVFSSAGACSNLFSEVAESQTTRPNPAIPSLIHPVPTELPTQSAPPVSSVTPRPPTPRQSQSTQTNTPTPHTRVASQPRPTIIGYSVAGRPLEIYRFGFGSHERLVIFGIHGGYEWNTIALADEIIGYLGNHPDYIPPGKRLFILRAFNPDGEARSHGHSGRPNENGVDLNRNFPVGWLPDWDKTGCWDFLPINAGIGPLSEPETQALARFLGSHQIEALISYHSAALGIFSGGEPPDPKSVDLAETVANVSDYFYPPIDPGCQMTGTLVDWAVSQGSAALDIELTNHEDTDFEQTLKILEVFLEWEP